MTAAQVVAQVRRSRGALEVLELRLGKLADVLEPSELRLEVRTLAATVASDVGSVLDALERAAR